MRIDVGGVQLRYCAKVGMAAGLGYLLAQGNHNEYSVHAAFAAALVVGTSVGEDLATSANRVKGTGVGVAAALLATALFGPNAITVGVAASLTTLIALAAGWGIQVARVGMTMCIITLVAHDENAIWYDLLRTANTLIGVAIGLAVSFFVWPVHGPAQVRQAVRDLLDTSTALLNAVEQGGQPLRPRQAALHEAVTAVVKAWRDLNREQAVAATVRVEEAQVERTLRLGVDVLSCTFGEPGPGAIDELRHRINALSEWIGPS